MVVYEGIVFLNEEENFFFVCFFVIVVFIIIGSFMVCMVIMKNKDMFKSFYNVNIFYFVIIDLLVFVVIVLIFGFIF